MNRPLDRYPAPRSDPSASIPLDKFKAWASDIKLFEARLWLAERIFCQCYPRSSPQLRWLWSLSDRSSGGLGSMQEMIEVLAFDEHPGVGEGGPSNSLFYRHYLEDQQRHGADEFIARWKAFEREQGQRRGRRYARPTLTDADMRSLDLGIQKPLEALMEDVERHVDARVSAKGDSLHLKALRKICKNRRKRARPLHF